jgi:hypothetical protein
VGSIVARTGEPIRPIDRADLRLARLPSLLPDINADFLCGTYECCSHIVCRHGAAETTQTGFPSISVLAAPILRPMVRKQLRGFVDGSHIQHLARMLRFDCHVWKSKIGHTPATRAAHRCSGCDGNELVLLLLSYRRLWQKFL